MPTSVKIVGGAPSPNTTGVPGVEQVVDPTFGASRVSIRPLDYAFEGRVLGHYRVAAPTGLVAGSGLTGQPAGSIIYSFQWTDTSAIAVLSRLSVGFALNTAGAAQIYDVDCILARQYTTAASAGTRLLPAAPVGSNRVRKLMNPSLVSDLRIAAATRLTAGTATLDASPFGISPMNQNNNVSGEAQFSVDLYALNMTGQHPIIIRQNEGFLVRLVTAWPNGSAIVATFYVTTEWAEVTGY